MHLHILLLCIGLSFGSPSTDSHYKLSCPLDGILTTRKFCHNDTSVGKHCFVETCADCSNGTTSHFTEDVDRSACFTRTIFHSDFVANDAVALAIWFISSGICMSAGVGGSAVYTPVGLMLLRYNLLTSTAISQWSNFGGSLAAVILNMRARHPAADRPLINFELALYMGPMLLFGALCGVVAQRALPDWILLICMVVVLGYTSVNAGMVAFARRKKDIASNAKAEEVEVVKTAGLEGCRRRSFCRDLESTDGHSMPDGTGSRSERTGSPDARTSSVLSESRRHSLPESRHSLPESRHSLSEGRHSSPVGRRHSSPEGRKSFPLSDFDEIVIERKNTDSQYQGKQYDAATWLRKNAAFPTKSIVYFVVIWVGRMVFMLLQGSRQLPSIVGVSQCSVGYWLLGLGSLIWLSLAAGSMGLRLVSKSVRRFAANTPSVEGDIQWNHHKLLTVSLAMFVAGVVAALIGSGGGTILGPVMLHLGVIPLVSSATSATMVTFTSSSVAILYIASAQVPWDVALTFFGTTFCGAFIGKSLIDAWVKKRNLTWVLTAILSCVIAIGTVLTATSGVIRYASKDWELDGLSSVCEA